jgi:hypothetical protein
MYSRKKLKNLLKKPLKNLIKLIKLYLKHLVTYYNYTLINKEYDNMDILEDNIDDMEDIFEENPPLKQYLDIRVKLKTLMKNYLDKKNIVRVDGTVYKDTIKYKIKKKQKNRAYIVSDNKIIVFLPDPVLLGIYRNQYEDDQSYYVDSSTGIIKSDSFDNASMGNNINSKYDPFGPYDPFNPKGLYGDASSPVVVVNDNELIGSPSTLSASLGMHLSLKEQYKKLMNYIKYTLLQTNISYFPALAFMDPNALTYSDLVAMRKTIERGYSSAYELYDTKFQLIDYALNAFNNLVLQLSKKNPTKKYNIHNMPMSQVLKDAIGYNDYIYVPIS